MLKVILLIGTLFAGVAQAVSPAAAQDFPMKQPVKIVVASSAGGLSDVAARITAEFLQRRLGQAVVVENKPGASSMIGADYVAKAPADGYTLYFTGASFSVLPAIRADLPYKLEEFTYLIRDFANTPLVMTSPKLPVLSIQELIRYMKENPGKLRYGSSGVGSINHIAAAMFESAAGVKGVHVPYTGIAPAYQDLLTGTIDAVFGGTVPFPKGITVVASNGTKRSPIYPELPTLQEAGVKGANWDNWFGLVAPANLPKPIADRLIAELSAVFKDPTAIEKFQAATMIAPGNSPLVGDQFRQLALEEQQKWKAVAERERITIQ
jgi:tripartite-type tricarboxylate transporter receptor subunit TctC